MKKEEIKEFLNYNALLAIKREAKENETGDYSAHYNYTAMYEILAYLRDYLIWCGVRAFKEYLKNFDAIKFLREKPTYNYILMTYMQEETLKNMMQQIKRIVL